MNEKVQILQARKRSSGPAKSESCFLVQYQFNLILNLSKYKYETLFNLQDNKFSQ